MHGKLNVLLRVLEAASFEEWKHIAQIGFHPRGGGGGGHWEGPDPTLEIYGGISPTNFY